MNYKTSDIIIHPLISYIREKIKEEITLLEFPSTIDHCDLIQNVLFRITTIPLCKIICNCKEINDYIQNNSLKSRWLNWSSVPNNIINNIDINKSILGQVISEQLYFIEKYSRIMDLENLKQKSLVEKNPNCKLRRMNGFYFLFDNERFTVSKKVFLKEVSLDYAQKLYSAFHYIHSPRGEIAYGLYIDSAEIPFSVISVNSIDRRYKRDALLKMGFLPNSFLEISRLYNLPNSPKNTSSVILSMVCNLISRTNSEIRGFITTHSPSFATSNSMISGGFEEILLTKNVVKRFVPVVNNQKTVMWEHTIKRKNSYLSTNYKESLSEYALIPEFIMIRFSKYRDITHCHKT